MQHASVANDAERAAEILDEALRRKGHGGGVFDRIRSVFGAAINIRVPPQLAAHYLPQITRGAVITTNYDRVIEEIYLARGRPLVPVWGAQTQVAAEYLPQSAPLLLKLHGDAFHIEDQVLTRAQYSERYGDADLDYSKSLPRLLEMLFSKSAVLFLGCSLSADRTTKVLMHVAARTKTKCFAVVPRPANAAGLDDRRRELKSFGIEPIWYESGDHDAIIPFLARLGVEINRNEPDEIGLGPVISTPLSKADDRAQVRLVKARENQTIARAKALLTEQDPDRQWAHYVDLRLELDAIDPREAMAIHREMVRITRAAQRTSAAAYAYFALFDAYRRMDDDRNAARVLNKVTDFLKNLPPCPDTIELNFTQANYAYHQRRLDDAERHSRLALREAKHIDFQHPTAFPRLWLIRGQALLRLGRARLGRAYLARALRAFRRNRDYYDIAHEVGVLAGYYFETNRPLRALRLARAGIRVAPVDSLADRALLYGNLGNALSGTTRYPEAVHAYRLAWWYERLGGSELAATAVQMGNVAWNEYLVFDVSQRSIHDNSGQLNSHLAWSLITFDQAIKMTEGMRATVATARLKVQRSLPKARSGVTGEALEDLRNAVRILRTADLLYLATAYNNRGLIWVWLGATRRARHAFEKALSIAGIHGKGIAIEETIVSNLSSISRKRA